MLKLAALAIIAFGTATVQAQAPTVDVGTGNWSALPEARVIGNVHIGSAVADEVARIGRERSCQVAGLGRDSVDLTVPFVLEFDDAGRVQRIVLRDIGCPELETLLGRAVQRLADLREYRPSAGPGWYRSALELSVD